MRSEKLKTKNKNHKLPKEWRKQLENSGKFFEQEIIQYVQNHSFGYVVPNDSFLDIETGESRELDVFIITGRKIGHRMNFCCALE